MTDAPEPTEFESDKDVVTEERLTVGGVAPDVVDANRQAWEMLAKVLGRDPVGAWLLAKINHAIVPVMDEADPPKPTGEIEVEWGAQFERDPEVPTLPVAYAYVGDGDEVDAA